MFKELKLLDRELKHNHFVRIQDSTNRAENSLFRALSMALMLSHQHFNEIKMELRLTLISNLQERRLNPYPTLHQPHILKKYQCDPELILDYWQHQQQQCFTNDNVILASAAFNTPICILTIDKEQYLNETYIMACRNPKESKIYIAKVGKKFYCAFTTEMSQRIRFIRQFISEQIINQVFQREEEEKVQKEQEPEEEKKYFLAKDEGISFRPGRKHKKSLSECNELQQQLFVEDRKKDEENNEPKQEKSSLFHSEQFSALTLQPPLSDPSNQNSNNFYSNSYDPSQQPSYQNYYSSYPYQHYMMPQQQYMSESNYANNETYSSSFGQPEGPVNNVRYTGRLKFFDQTGNYGFLVIDSLNIDLFVHYDDLSKAGLSRQQLFSLKNSCELRFQFTYYQYEGKHKKSKKAVDLQLLPSE